MKSATHSVPSSNTVPYRTQGRLHLCFARAGDGEQTILRVREQTPPLRVVRAFRHERTGGSALAHIHNLSGGVLGGDHLTLVAEVGRDARAQITSTGSTRVYRHRRGMPTATQVTQLRVESGGLLEYLPDSLIPFAGSRYRQETEIDLAPGAGLFLWELLTPGREASNEVFAYEQLHAYLRICADGQPIAREQFVLEPGLRPLTSPARLGPFRYMATFYACCVGRAAADWLALEATLDELGRSLAPPDEALWGVSTLPAHGLLVRGLGRSGRAMTAGLVEMWRAAKRALYGQEAVLPRKVY